VRAAGDAAGAAPGAPLTEPGVDVKTGEYLLAVDGKVTLDDNASFRQEHARFDDTSNTDPIEARARDPQVTHRLALLMVRNLLDLIPNARPIGLNGLFKGVAKLTFWAMAADQKDVAHILVEGIAAAPPDFVDAALDRMESMQNGLFWEVNERVIAFDWVEQPLRAEIPRLRAALRRAKSTGHTLTIELERAIPVTQDLVKPEPIASASAGPAIAPVSAEPAG